MLASRLKAQFGNFLMAAIGLFFLVDAVSTLDLGTPRRMGPGAFPMLAGLILTILAFVSVLKTFHHAAAHGKADARSVAAVIASIIAFVLATPALGVLPGAALCVFLASYAVPKLAIRRRAGLTAAVTFGIWLLFIVALRLPFEAVKGF